MLKKTFVCAALLSSAVSGSLYAQDADHNRSGSASAPAGSYAFAFTTTETQYSVVDTGLLTQITAWLSANFELPASRTMPAIELASPERIAAIRYRGLASPPTQAVIASPAYQSGDIVAVYDDTRKTIYLPDGWKGHTPAEQSVLVHEMVHFLQSSAQFKYGCPQAREKLAYQAQEQWLSRSGRTLQSEFEIDAFSLLIHTNCTM